MSEDQETTGPQAVIEESREFWRQFAKRVVLESVSALEEAAKQVATINGLLIGFYATAVAFAQLPVTVSQTWELLLFVAPVFFWLLSLGSALLVYWPSSDTINIASSKGAQETIKKIGHRKRNCLRVSIVFVLLGISLLVIVLFLYLGK